MNNFCIYCGATLKDTNAKTCPNCLTELTPLPQSPGGEQSSAQRARETTMEPAKGLKGKTFAYIGIIFAIASVIILPIVFGPLAIICGYISTTRGERDLGRVAMILGIVLAVIGFILGFLYALMTY
jgi:hypothetical protein